MRRALLVIALFLILGAATSVGVAWLIAAFEVPGVEMRLRQYGLAGPWTVQEWVGPGSIDRVGTSWKPGPNRPEVQLDDLPSWSRFHRPPGAERLVVVEDVRGWPWPCLRCQWEDSTGGMLFSDYVLTTGLRTRPLGGTPTGNQVTAYWVVVRQLRALPTRLWWPAFAGDTFVWAGIWLIVFALFLLRGHLRRLKRQRTGRCLACGYELRAIESERCPECGRLRDERIPLLTKSRLAALGTLLGLVIAADAVGVVLAVTHRVGPEAVHLAARHGDPEKLRRQLKRGVPVDHAVTTGQDEIRGTTPLMWAARAGQLEAIRLLLDRGADVNVTDANGKSALMWAASYDRAKAIRLLAEAGAELDGRDRYGRTALARACFLTGRPNAVKALIEAGADLDPLDQMGGVPLAWAAWFGPSEIVQMLVEAGAYVNPEITLPPIVRACFKGDLESVRILVAAGADINPKGMPLLSQAANSGNADLVRFLLEHGAPLSVADEDGWSPLQYAVNNSDLETVRVLLEAGADPHVVTDDGETLLFWGDLGGGTEMSELLLGLGIDLEGQASDGTTVLMWRAGSGDLASVQALLDAGADPSIKDPAGRTARDYAQEHTGLLPTEDLRVIVELLEAAQAEQIPRGAQDGG